MQPGGFGFRYEYCYLCNAFSPMSATIAMHCPCCSESVCERCVAMYRDVGFALFLHREDSRILREYLDNPESADVHIMHEEYKDTGPGREHLANRIAAAAQFASGLKDKLAASEARRSVFNALKGALGRALGCTNADNEEAFVEFLGRTDPDSLCMYQRDPKCAMHLCRGLCSKVFALREEFNNTAWFRKDLTQRIKRAEEFVVELQDKLSASEVRWRCSLNQ